jgi:replicative DNA helicase
MTSERVEDAIFSNLLHNENYARKVIPFIKESYFQDVTDRTLFNLIDTFVAKYNKFPTKESLLVDLQAINNLQESTFKDLKKYISDISEKKFEDQWLVDKTEEFCKDKALYNALMDAIKIVDDGKNKGNLSVGSIPKILSDALGVSFDTSIGHDFLDNADQRYDFYHLVENKVKFDLDYFNKITKGGIANKTLNIIMASTGVGKSLFMCHCAANNLSEGLNVLYITLEMAEERIAERIDANLLDMTIDELKQLPKDSYLKKINRVKKKTDGKLIIKEYPTASVGSANFRHLLNELSLKKDFKPDIIYIDYLNICCSSRFKNMAGVNSYTLVKSIAEELRGLAIEFDVPIISATQTNRSGYDNSDVDLSNTSESFGLPATCDFMFALISNEQLESLNQIMVKQLKNRYNDLNYYKKFVIGVDRSKMRLYDVEESAQSDIVDNSSKKEEDRPVMDNTVFGSRMNDDADYRKQKMREFF